MKRLWTLLSILLMLLSGTANAKDTLVIGISQFPATFHPSIDATLAKTYILGAAYRPLTAYDPSWTLVCMLCERLPTLENGLARREPGGIALEVRLRAGATWADGVAVTADDLVLAWKIGRSPTSGFANTEIFRIISRIDVIDPKTVVMHLTKVTFDYNALNDFRPLPAHLDARIFDADPAHYSEATAYMRDPTQPGLWNGPYRIVKIEAGSHVILERNPYWDGDAPQFQRVVIRVVENTAALEATLLTGGVDMVAGEVGLTLEQAMAFERRHHGEFRVVTKAGLAYEHLDLNLDDPDLGNILVRRALSLGIDRAAISTYLFADRQPPAAGFISPSDRPYDPDLAPIAHDPDQAGRLLDQAGYRLNQDGVRVAPDGHVLAFELVTTSGVHTRELVAQVLQNDWRKIGVLLRVKYEPPRILFGSTLTKRRYRGMVMYAEYSSPENSPRLKLHSQSVVTPANNWSGQNYTDYVNPKMDTLIDTLEKEPDFQVRLPLWRQIQALYADDLPAIPLYFRSDPHIWPFALAGIEPTGHEDPTTLWIEHWRWREGS